ncbi:MAG: hypothetical protein WC364_15060 [Eubacteriales bacterium]
MPKWARELCWKEPFRSILLKHGFLLSFFGWPFGKVVATARLAGCEKITEEDKQLHTAMTESCRFVAGNEYHFGDYIPGRYAWILEDIQALPEPVPAKGMQGLWEWKGENVL